MCGIAGLINRNPASGGGPKLARVRAAMVHRGPNDWGVYSSGPSGAGAARVFPDAAEGHDLLFLHLRLAIIDLTESGWQPMLSPAGRQVLVFNGEIYNYLTLRAELEQRGHHFRSRSDSEVLLHALQEWGAGCLPKLVGMFAFVYADLDRDEVLLARDPFGIKPLYWAPAGEGVAFASELPALLALTGQPRQVDPARLYAFLRFGVTDHGEGTLFAGASQLPAGHTLTIRRRPWSMGRPEPYWTPSRRAPAGLSPAAAAEAVRAQFCENIRLHLQSDVPLGTALSGGIDSSAIVCGIRHVAGPGAEIHAFSFVPEQEELSEARWIALAAERAGATVRTVRPAPEEVAGDLAAVIRAQGEPFGSPSIYAQYRVFKLAREHGVTVMLDGQGADELFAGYRPYLGARLAGLARRGSWLRAGRLVAAARRVPGTGARGAAMLAADALVPSALQGPMRQLVGRDLMPRWMDGRWFEAHGVRPASTKYTGAADPFWGEMERALSETSLPHLLRYEDRNSMAMSIESRVPFLTAPMLDLAWSLPEEYLVDDRGTSKAVFRQAMRGIVPDAILDRRDKLGFVTPVAEWMTAERLWVDGILKFAESEAVPGLDIRRATEIWRGVKPVDTRMAGQLWRCVSYLEWVRQFEVRGCL